MKNRNILLILAIVPMLAVTVHNAGAQSQHEMNRTAEENFQKADAQLNIIYKKVLADQDEQGRKKLIAAERAWIAYRDAEAEFQADGERGGSITPYIYSSTKTRLTKLRIKELSPDEEPEKKK